MPIQLPPDIADQVARALREDIGSGDVTTRACVPESQPARGHFVAREPLVVAGLAYALFGIETKGRSIEAIDDQLATARADIGMTSAARAD